MLSGSSTIELPFNKHRHVFFGEREVSLEHSLDGEP